MMANPEKFNAMFVTKGKNDNSGNKMHIKGIEIMTAQLGYAPRDNNRLKIEF